MSEQTPLPRPIRQVLQDQVEPTQVARVWRKVDAGRHRRADRSPWIWALAAGMTAGSLLILIQRHTPLAPELKVAAPPIVAEMPGPRPPEPIPEAPPPPTQERPAVWWSPASLAEVTSDRPERIAIRLTQGELELRLLPTPRVVEVDCGWAKVISLGARAKVERDRQRVMIAVEEGEVRIERPGEAPQILRGPAILRVARPTPADPEVNEAAAPEPPPAVAPKTESSPSPDQLLADADSARQAGDDLQAIGLLTTLIDRYPDDPRRSVASFTRGRLEFDRLQDPKAAARSFALALQLGLPAALVDDGWRRFVAALEASGAWAEAEVARAEYQALFPKKPPLPALTPGAPRP
ncbi:MAG: hypothetical protein IPG45_22330 [Deltaproteobacteria bacterium]|nr:hypothetical protein [Deltaproteobacteria bacterium]